MIALLLLVSSAWAQDISAPTVVRIAPGSDLPYRLQTAVILAHPNTIVELPEGRFDFLDELVIRTSHLTLRGQGMDKTILTFRKQFNGGQGVLAGGNAFTVEDLAIEDTPGDALKISGVNGATIRRVRVEWTRGPNPSNGSYGLYPVQSQNVLIEDCVVRGASDAGVYVGQSHNIIVRHNRAEYNVAGIEIENSQHADVYENVSTHNAAGILVFDLPDLLIKNGGHTRVFNNQIIENNTGNFAPKGNIVGIVPGGTGFMAMANRDIEVFGNEIRGHKLASIALTSYLVSELPINDKLYNPIPRRINIHDNHVEKMHGFHINFGSKIDFLINALFFLQGKRVADILYDGIGETYNGAHGLPDDDRICLGNNVAAKGKPSRFGNLQLANSHWYLPFPGGPVLTKLAPHACQHAAIPAVALDEPLPVPVSLPDPAPEVIAALCSMPVVSGPNWAALAAVNCPQLSQYRLFSDATDPTRDTRGGVEYDLTTPLFSDYSTKHRFIFTPPFTKAVYSADDAFDFPVGTVIAKTFGFGVPERVVETRLLVHRAEGWVGLPYVWRDNRADADLSLGGGLTDLAFNDGQHAVQTRYPIPSANQCITCHAAGSDGMQPIGPKARLLNRDHDFASGRSNQLTEWTRLGILDGAPADPTKAPRLPVWNDPRDGTVAQRARAYLEVNCAHCHSMTGLARNTGLFLGADVTNETAMGICKPPIAAGIGAGNLLFDIVPGKPRKSIMVFRLNSVHAKVKMPQIGRSVIHTEGRDLVAQWIKGMKGGCK
ncbi:MAG: right-handed parallel beta-helix repeat-containing protein [Deltaproteobacteria bacterium]|nr:right-handed parallel beta-helix repeat-containing protein [Deltaproteobacteria bacterium]